MAENGYGPVAGHAGRIPNYGRSQPNPMGNAEPPACIQNAMMTKDKKPFTYTPGGLDLSQIKTPSMARRLARQRSHEEYEQAYAPQQTGNGTLCQSQGGVPPPPPPPPQIPGPPPPPPLLIQAPNSKSPKPIPVGERPEIVIPENPIGMLRKTNSPYHWEAEKADQERLGEVPKFVEKVPSPLTLKMPPSSFSQQPPQTYNPQGNQRQNYGSNLPESPVHKPAPQYAHQQSSSPNANATPTRDLLQRQDSQFNKSPLPYASQSPIVNNGQFSPSPNTSWRQPERRDSPSSPQINRAPTHQYSTPTQANSGPAYHTLPRNNQRIQDNYVTNLGAQKPNYSNAIYNNTSDNQSQSPKIDTTSAPWRTNTLNRYSKDNDDSYPQHQAQTYNNNEQTQNYVPPWKNQEVNNNQSQQYTPQRNVPQDNRNIRSQPVNQAQQYSPPWVTQEPTNNRSQDNYSPQWKQDANNNRTAPVSPPTKQNQQQEQPRYQSHISIPVTPRKPKPEVEFNVPAAPQKEAVYVTQEPIYFCPDSPKSIPPWVKTQKEKTKTPPPEWCHKPLEGGRSVPRELYTPPRDSPSEPEWVRKSSEMQGNTREVISPPKYPQTAQPTWSTIPSENRKSLPRDNPPNAAGTRVIPVQMDDHRQGNQQPQLRIVIDMQNPNVRTEPTYSQPTQRIMRVLSPQLVKLDDGQQTELPTLNRNLQNNQQNQPKMRIIPIQLEDSSDGPNKMVYYHKFTQEGPPRQSKAFKVLQVITGTQEQINNIESEHGFSDL